MLEYLGLPEVPYEVYEHSPLALTVCQVRFSSVLSIGDPDFIARFQESIRERYPLTQSYKQSTIQLNPETGEAQVGSAASPQWRFADATRNWTAILAPDFLTLETRAYQHFDDFLDRLRQLLQALEQHIHPAIVSRFGLRYINEIRPGHPDWTHIIQPQLLEPVGSSPIAEHVQQTVQLIQLRFPNSQGLTMQHGIFPAGTTLIGDQSAKVPPTQPFYLLDYDAFQEFSPVDGSNVDFTSLLSSAEDFNQAIYRLFRWSITEEFRASMGVRSNDSH